MKVRPILFNGPMVCALLDGRKTQTRRVLKPQPLPPVFRWVMEDYWWLPKAISDTVRQQFVTTWPNAIRCPYGQPGDLLWVRETIERAQDWGGIGYPADGTWYPDSAWEWKRNTVPSIHMPRRLNRLTLELTGVRVERLQDISEADAIAEGLKAITKDGALVKYGIPDADSMPGRDDQGWPWGEWRADPRAAYARLWESINRPGSWEANPWVWVLEFQVHQVNVDELLKRRAA